MQQLLRSRRKNGLILRAILTFIFFGRRSKLPVIKSDAMGVVTVQVVARSSPLEMSSHPIGCERPKLVADIEADMVAVLEIDEFRRSRGFACKALTLGGRDQAVATTEYDEQRALDLMCDVVEAQAAGHIKRFSVRARMAADQKHLRQVRFGPREE